MINVLFFFVTHDQREYNTKKKITPVSINY